MLQDGLGTISVIVDCVTDDIKYLVASIGRLMKLVEMKKEFAIVFQ
jgi:hypothetical protein